MPAQMLSGPDLGGGFLHQLSLDEEEGTTIYTYHAQDGGSDAGGPPAGPLDPFGYVHPSVACMFGGPRCWHRRFRLELADAPRVRAAYNRSRFVLQAMMDQQYAGAPTAIDVAVREVVARLSAAPELAETDWFFSGSVAAWLLGAPIAPRDIDLFVLRRGVDAVGLALREYLIEPTATTDWPGLGIVRAARAFVGTFAAGARVEWAVPLEAPKAIDAWGATPDGPRMVVAERDGRRLRVPRPEYTYARLAWRRRREALESFGPWLRSYGPDRELLAALLDRYAVGPEDIALAGKALESGP